MIVSTYLRNLNRNRLNNKTFYRYCKSGNLAAVREHLRQGIQLSHVQVPGDYTRLHDLLIESGFHIDMRATINGNLYFFFTKDRERYFTVDLSVNVEI